MTTRNSDYRTLAERFVRELSKVQSERPARPGVTESGELEWVLWERIALLGLVGQARAERGLPNVEMTEILRVEQLAVGHVDYTRKLAFGAAKLVLAN